MASPEQDFRKIVAARIVDDRARNIVAGQHRRGGAQILRQFQRLQDALALRRRQPLQLRRFDIDRVPVGIELTGQPRGAADHMLGPRTRPDAGQQRRIGLPHRVDRFFDPVRLHVILDPVGGAAQRQFAQRDQIAFAEKILRRTLGLLRLIHLAGPEPRQQFIGRKIDQHHFIGFIEHGIGQGFRDADPGDAADHIVQAFQMLHIDRRIHIDAGVQQFVDILPALRMARTGRIRMREFIHQDQRRLQRQRRIQIEFLDNLVPILDLLERQHGQSVQQRGGLAAAMRLDNADQHRTSFRLQLAGRSQHRISLADAGRRAEIDPQLATRGAPFLLLHLRQQRIRVRALVIHLKLALS